MFPIIFPKYSKLFNFQQIRNLKLNTFTLNFKIFYFSFQFFFSETEHGNQDKK